MVYAWDNDSTQNAHIKHSNDNKQKAYMERHRDNKAYERFKHMPDYRKGVKHGTNWCRQTKERFRIGYFK